MASSSTEFVPRRYEQEEIYYCAKASFIITVIVSATSPITTAILTAAIAVIVTGPLTSLPARLMCCIHVTLTFVNIALFEVWILISRYLTPLFALFSSSSSSSSSPSSSICAPGLSSGLPSYHMPAPTPTPTAAIVLDKATDWGLCPSAYPASLECGQLRVPINHEKPEVDSFITLGVTRSRATSSTGRRLGNLIVDPGGPGVSEISKFVTHREGELVSQRLMEFYDIIAMDPRGVGASNPIQCDVDLFNQRVPIYVESQSDFDSLMYWNKALGESCANLTGPSFQYLDTISVAKDLDLLRQLGSQYAELFPGRVGRMVLDGIVDHSQRKVSNFMTGSTTTEDTFNAVARWCNTTSECALYHRDVPALFDELVDNANMKPIPAPGCHGHAVDGAPTACRPDVTGYEIIDNSKPLLSLQSRWVLWSKALLEALNGNATLLSTPLLTFNVFPITEDYSLFADRAIVCQDWLRLSGPRASKDLIARFKVARALAPHTRGISEMSGIHTGVEWAIGLREQMPTAVNIFRNGFGHTSYKLHGKTQRVIDEYLIEGKMAEDLTTLDS
ncbi:proteinase [Nannizzia gypsea CBS 118893]|uniref:Proteinase n=1 Tax=Arthroderma gypseum (strain ATCC MYA-4604 / CBS 118893) TaxID=535722 RepID=E4UX77_ARTGP|nr:proteinase [Nannizzia gypsea CBS 118893]EFR02664.1 proteinase [Nannizzia gypsea CBS 118893]